MNRRILEQIRRSSASIRSRWADLLRLQPVTSPLGAPEVMTMLVPEAIADLVRALDAGERVWAARGRRGRPPVDCGHNPYRTFFDAGRQAMAEAVVLAETACHVDRPDETAMAEVMETMRVQAESEMNAFCSVCRKYRLVAKCAYAGNRRASAALSRA